MSKPAASDIRSQPAYTLAEAARYLKLAPATLRAWLIGRDYPKGTGKVHSVPLIRPAKNPPPTSPWPKHTDAGAAPHGRTPSDRAVIDDLDLLTNLELLRDLEMYAPTDAGVPAP